MPLAPVATAQLADPDPLLVGSKRIIGQTRHSLIGAFELTTAERYVLDEFCKARPITPGRAEAPPWTF